MLSQSITAAQTLTLTNTPSEKTIQAWNDVVAGEDRKKEPDLSTFKKLELTEYGSLLYVWELVWWGVVEGGVVLLSGLKDWWMVVPRASFMVMLHVPP